MVFIGFSICLQEIEKLIDKISEMAAVMQKAAAVDDAMVVPVQEKLKQLEQENTGLREILEVCTTAKQKIMSGLEAIETEEKSIQTDPPNEEKTDDDITEQGTSDSQS